MSKKRINTGVQFLTGITLLVIGIALVLANWSEVVVLFKSVIGMVLALAGMLVLYSIKK